MTDDIFTVVDRPLSPDAIAEAVDDPGAGGVVIFSGIVRNQTDGRPVKFLEYEAHAPMAEAKMREIGGALPAPWGGGGGVGAPPPPRAVRIGRGAGGLA